MSVAGRLCGVTHFAVKWLDTGCGCNKVSSVMSEPFKKWQCIVCGFIYDEAEGLPEEGIPPGTRWEDVPEDWECPECGAGKADFEMVEIEA